MAAVETIATGLFAVFGTLLGVLATYWVQKSTVKQQEDLAREERLRQDRVGAYTEFAGALTSYRRGRMDRFYARRGENGLDPEAIRHETYRLRSKAQEAEFRVQLLAPSQELIELAQEALRSIDRLGTWDQGLSYDDVYGSPEALQAFEAARDRSRAAIGTFIGSARRHVGQV